MLTLPPVVSPTRVYSSKNHDFNRLSNTLNSISNLKLRTMFGMILRQLRLILTVVLLIMLAAVGLLSQLHNRYTTEALLSIDESTSQLLGQENAMAGGATLSNQVDTEVEVLGSTSVALGVIDRLALWRDPEFGFTGVSWLTSLQNLIGISVLPVKVPVAIRLSELPVDLQAQLVKKLSASVKVTRRGLTSIISVQGTSKNPEKSALVANSMAETYLDLQIDSKVNAAKRAASFLAERVDQIAKDIQNVDNKIESFILNQSKSIGTPEARIELTRMRNEMVSLTSDQTSLAAELARIESIELDPGSAVPTSVSAELRSLAEKRQQLTNELLFASPQKDIANQLKALDQQLVDAAKIRAENVRTELTNFDSKKMELRKQLQDLFSRQQVPNDVAVNLYRLQREAESNRKLYETYSTRLGEVQQQASLALPNTRIVSPAIVPHDPSYPPSLLILALSAVLGLVFGTAIAITRESLVGGFASIEQAEAVTGFSVIATVPTYDAKDTHDAILTVPFSHFSESIRRLRIGVTNELLQLNCKTILVTSTEPGEGKSTLAISLARSFSIAGHSTILIDADLRHPSIQSLVGERSPTDLVELLHNVTNQVADGTDLENFFYLEKKSGLSIITTEALENQASDLLVGSANFAELLAIARMKFEYIVIDSPPVGYLVDAKIMSPQTDLVLYVVKQNSTSQQDTVLGLRDIVSNTGRPAVSIVLNNVRSIFGGYYYRNSRYNNYYKLSA